MRNPAADPTLPTWGTGKTEWRGYLTKDQHPHEVNPKHGYFISWNNKPAPGFATDGEYAYSQTYRSVLLDQQLKKQLAAHPHDLVRSDVVKAMETAASQDLDGVTLNDLLLKYVGNRSEPAGVKAMLAQLKAWNADRLAPAQGEARATSQYADHAAVAISDELVPNLIRAFYDPILAAGGSGGVVSTGGATLPGYAKVPMQWVNTPELRRRPPRLGLRRRLRGLPDVDLPAAARADSRPTASVPSSPAASATAARSTCHAAVDQALQTTYDALVKANGSTRRRVVDRLDRVARGRRDDAGVRLDHPAPAGHRRPAAPRLAEPADVPAGRRVPAPPGAVRPRRAPAASARSK